MFGYVKGHFQGLQSKNKKARQDRTELGTRLEDLRGKKTPIILEKYWQAQKCVNRGQFFQSAPT